jgi:hypothetical protein
MTGVVVSGTVMGAPTPAIVRLWRADTDEIQGLPLEQLLDVARANTDVTGRFTLVGVPQGDYILAIDHVAGIPNTNGLSTVWARQLLTVGEKDISDVAVSMMPGLRVSGRLVLDPDETLQSPIERMEVFLNRPGHNTVRATMAAGGKFSAEGLLPGSYTFSVSASQRFSLGWIQTGGSRVTARPVYLAVDRGDVSLVITSRFGQVEGTVASVGSVPSGPHRVLLFPADRQEWRDALRDDLGVRGTIPNRDGFVSIPSVPPGEYFIVAVSEEMFDIRWRDSTSLERLSRVALRFRLAPGQTSNVKVPIFR